MFITLKTNYKRKMGFPSFPLISTIFILLLFNACSSKNVKVLQKSNCSWKDINLNGKNAFCSTPRTSLINNNNILIAFDNGAIIKWDLETNKILNRYDTTTSYLSRTLAIDKKTLFAGSGNMSVFKYSLDGKLIKEENYSKGTIFKILSYKDKLYVAFGNAEIGVLDAKNLELVSSFPEHQYLVYDLEIDKNSNILYSSSDDNTIISWDILNDGKLSKIKQVVKLDKPIRNIVNCDTTYLITTGNGDMMLYDKQFTTLLDKFKNNDNNIISASYINKFVFIGDTTGNLSIYSLLNEKITLKAKYKTNGLIRAINQVDKLAIIISKTGEILTIDTNEL